MFRSAGIAQRVSQAGLSVCSIDPSPKLIWPNNYGVYVDEFEAMDLLDCFNTTWSDAVVYIDDQKRKDLDRPYGRVNGKQLKSKMLQKCIWCEISPGKGQATVILDAAGFSRCLVQYDKPYNPGYQMAYGILAKVEEHPFDVNKMVFMDWRDSYLIKSKELRERNSRIPTFLYVMPFSSDRIFLGETSLVASHGVPMDDIKERINGGQWAPSSATPESCGIGNTARMVHPSTGYMIASTLAAAPNVADSIVWCLDLGRNMLGKKLSAEAWRDLWSIERRRQREFFCFGMDILLKLDLPATRRLEIMAEGTLPLVNVINNLVHDRE
ncbi:hypothetical protein DITRI_Ditri20bG0070700 [Diplodiscus trichospermus]